MAPCNVEMLISGSDVNLDVLGLGLDNWDVCALMGLLLGVAVLVAGQYRVFRAPTWANLCLRMIGPLLIVLGIAGKFGVVFNTEKVATDVVRTNRSLASRASTKSSKPAGGAGEEGATVAERAAQARKKAEDVRVATAEANQQRAGSKKEAGEGNPNPAALSPQRIIALERDRFLAAWKPPPSGHKPDITVLCVPDAEDFGRDLVALLRDAGFTAEFHTRAITEAFPRTGGGMALSAGRNRQADAAALADSLLASGITSAPIPILAGEDTKPDDLTLLVTGNPRGPERPEPAQPG